MLLQWLSLLSDCCNDNPRPVICTLQFPSSTSACIFSPLCRPWPDSHLRWEFLPLLLIYSSIMAHRSFPQLRDGGRGEKPPHWSLTPSASWWGHFQEGLSHCSWVWIFCLFSCLNKPEAAICSVYDDRQVYMTGKCSETFGNGAPVLNIHYTSFMWQVFPKVQS